MRLAHPGRFLLAALATLAAPFAAHAQDIKASEPVDLSVTIYRNPYRGAGGFDLNELYGFALVTETRRVVLTPGQHRLRFEGVADGIEPASAIVTGLPSGVIEKNRDAALLSPSALVDAAQAQQGRVLLTRTGPNGAITRREGTIRSSADGGVVFETPDGFEGLRCSGLPETFAFESAGTGLSALPTLSVVTRVNQRIEATVQLSYLARGFDWAADYGADLAKDGRTIDVGGWVTLANGNGVGFPNARVQVVAGKLNRESGEIEPIDFGQPILAQCWPQGSTSDNPEPVYIERAFPFGFDPERYDKNTYAERVVVTGSRVPGAPEDAALPVMAYSMEEAENLGDLKLYRVPMRTTVASRQSKQVRLLDADAVPVKRIYVASYWPGAMDQFQPMNVELRTRNTKENKLGIPLPSGRVSVFETVGSSAAPMRLLAGETGLRDLAVDEDVEITLGGGAAVQARHVRESLERAAPDRAVPPLLKGAAIRSGAQYNDVNRIEITNAHPFPIQAEVSIQLGSNQDMAKADVEPEQKNGRPTFTVTVPANDSREIHYQTVTYF